MRQKFSTELKNYFFSYAQTTAAATSWFFNALLALTWPPLRAACGDAGGFSWFAAWTAVCAVLVWCCVPETLRRPSAQLGSRV